MTTPVKSPLRNWENELKEEKTIDFYISHSDSGHIIVSRFRNDGSKETIGHVYIEVDGEEIRYFSTNRRGREIFPPTTDFNTVEMKYERYARLLAMQQKTKENNKHLKLINQFKNPTIMQTQTQSNEQKPKKVNQLIFVEYEKVAGDGHFVTIVDSYRNVIGRIHKSFNDETKKYEYISYDHAGNLMGKNEKLWQLKNEFVNHREQLLEQAHQRRIISKEQAKEKSERTPQSTKGEERKKETENLRQGKKGQEKQVTKGQAQTKSNEIASEKEDRGTTAKENAHENDEQNRQEEREQELDDIRNDNEDDRGDMDMER